MTWMYVFMYRFMQMHLSSLCTQMYVFLFMSERESVRGATGCNHVSMSCWMTIVFLFLIEVALVTIGPMCVYEALI